MALLLPWGAWLCLSPRVAADRGVHWLFPNMLPFRVPKTPRDTTEHKNQAIRTGPPWSQDSSRSPQEPHRSVVGHVPPKSKSIYHTLCSCVTTPTAPFQAAAGMGHSRRAQQLLWAGLFPSLGLPNAMVVRSMGIHTRHLHTNHSSRENGDPSFPADLCNEKRWATGHGQKHGQVQRGPRVFQYP